jgi:hypothetical protein
MTRASTLYSRCPSCHANGLVQQVQATYRCAACNFDYGTLASDQAAREAWMLENLRLGGFFILTVLFLHRQILALAPAESMTMVRAFAAQHGVPLPTGTPFTAARGVAIILGAFALMVAIGALLNYLFS